MAPLLSLVFSSLTSFSWRESLCIGFSNTAKWREPTSNSDWQKPIMNQTSSEKPWKRNEDQTKLLASIIFYTFIALFSIYLPPFTYFSSFSHHISPSSRLITSSADNRHSSTTTTLCLDFPPLSTYTPPLRVCNKFAIYRLSSSFASPSLGGAAILTPIYSGFISVTLVFFAFGFASIVIKNPYPFFLMLPHFAPYFFSSFSFLLASFFFSWPFFFIFVQVW